MVWGRLHNTATRPNHCLPGTGQQFTEIQSGLDAQSLGELPPDLSIPTPFPQLSAIRNQIELRQIKVSKTKIWHMEKYEGKNDVSITFHLEILLARMTSAMMFLRGKMKTAERHAG